MKYTILLLLFTCACASEQPYATRGKQLYQKSSCLSIPIGMAKVQPPKAITMAEHEQIVKAREYEMGSYVKYVGWGLMILGACLHFCTVAPTLKSIGSSIMSVGGVTVLGGIGLQKTVKYDTAITVISVIAVALLLYKKRAFSLFEYIKQKVVGNE